MSYKWCIVPGCTNTSTKTPEKLFVSVPKTVEMRTKWLQLAHRNPKDIVVNSSVFFCEDHFDMEKDMANYRKYKMGFSQRVIMVDGVLPSKFHCQQDHRKRMSDTTVSQPASVKRKKIKLTQEYEDIQPTETLQEVCISEAHATTESQTWDKSTYTVPIVTAEKLVKLNFKQKVYFGSKAKVLTKNTSVSPYKHWTTSGYTSPSKIKPCLRIKPSKTDIINIRKRIGFIDEERSDSDISLYTEAPNTDSSTFTVTSFTVVSDSSTNISDTNEGIAKMKCLQHTLRLIAKKPMMYIGISKETYFIVDLIHKHTHIPHEHILLCLKKIRLDSTFSELQDNFGLSLSYGSKLFLKNIPVIASVLHPFIVYIDNLSIKKMLPVSFRYNYFNVSCIIDFLEIEIQKPSKALFQSMTWSKYKKRNTVKYLISYTPNGLVNYISPGFGGRVCEVTILQICNFLDGLKPGNIVMADRGFKNIEPILDAKGIKLLRPPSVKKGSKLSKLDVRQAKIIARLRIHVERVIRQIREFHMLKQYSVINKHYLGIINDVIVIACALINIQDSLIK